jgi:glycosyltransferase involved in cell wall biosynthesis
LTDKINIGIVANTAFNIYNFRLGLIRDLQREGYHVIAIAPKDVYADLLRENGVEYIELKNLARKGTNPVNDLLLVNELRKIYKREKLHAVLQYTIKPNIYGTLAARFTHTKTICTVTGLGYTFLNNTLSSKIAHRLYRYAFGYASKVLFQNKDDLQTFLENKLVQEYKTMIVHGSGIDTDYFYSGFCKAEIRSHAIQFLMIGRLLRDKGVYEYVEAARNILRKNKEVGFHLLGEIDYDNPSAIKKEELQSWIDEKTIRYHFYAKDTRPFICNSDCVVLPSYREGMPRVILEAMSMAKPCITTDAPGCRDAVIDGETGFICKVADAASLQEALEKFMVLNDEYKKRLGVNARKRVETLYSNGNITVVYIHLLRNLV